MDQVNSGVTKKKHPFVELLTVTFFMLAVPYVIFLMCRALLRTYTNNSSALINAQSEAFAGLIGTGVMFVLFLSDSFIIPLMAVLERWHELIADIRAGMWRSGLKTYAYNLKEKGILFWYYLALFGFEIWLIIDGCQRFVELLGWQ
ncbi:MAG: hypothetical protein K6A14_07230 [Erysipelotrichaceae bacterium]|nr:hypothetical protein [Erysipelotrichaceae bacterium]